ncbi:MAG: DUF1203 domain-containing protein [Bacteroidota bacterium]
MEHNFQIEAINYSEVKYLFQLSDEELSKVNAVRMVVDQKPGYPCRVSLQDAEIGEEVILFPYMHHDVKSPYKSSGPVFVRKNAETAQLRINEIPVMLNHRLLSIRAYDKDSMIVKAEVIEGNIIADAIEYFLSNSKIEYIHVHNAKPGCYNCRIMRV